MNQGIRKFCICRGDSMAPKLKKTSVISYRRFDSYKKGDIVIFKAKNNIQYCHRILDIDYQWDQVFTAKGDNRSKSEDYETRVPIQNIIGKMTWNFP